MRPYNLQRWSEGKWRDVESFDSINDAVSSMLSGDQCDRYPRRILHWSSALLTGKWCTRDTPVNDIKPFWIVVSVDKPGPVERGEREYQRHHTRSDAVNEARRLSVACRGGRFYVLETIFATGFLETDIVAEVPI